jgi:putative FmdB family regulatory protein
VPIYEYRCLACRREFEELVSFSTADAPQACPSCGESSERKMSSFAMRVSGGAGGSSGSGKSCGGCRKSSCATC